MPVIVQKYGGSSVGTIDRIKSIALKLKERREQGYDLVVIVSAMAGATDSLLSLAHQVSAAPQKRELDMLLTTGERTTMALLSMALNDLGIPAISFTGSQSGIITNDSHVNARIIEVRPWRVRDEIERGRVVIIAGFQGMSYRREVTTLGRGGSDTTAVAMAAALGAEACEIYSDVDGVFSGDPRVVDQAKKLREIDYEEMQELSECGAKVLNAQAVEFARKAGIPIDALSTFENGSGTRVTRLADGTCRVAGVTGQKNLALVSLSPASAADAASLASSVCSGGAELLEIGFEGGVVTALASMDNVHGGDSFEDGLRTGFHGKKILVDRGLGRVTAVGKDIGRDAGLLALAADALKREGILPSSLHVEKNRFSFLVDLSVQPAAVRAVHRALLERDCDGCAPGRP